MTPLQRAQNAESGDDSVGDKLEILKSLLGDPRVRHALEAMRRETHGQH
jgi:hypothetical protein